VRLAQFRWIVRLAFVGKVVALFVLVVYILHTVR